MFLLWTLQYVPLRLVPVSPIELAQKNSGTVNGHEHFRHFPRGTINKLTAAVGGHWEKNSVHHCM
jgi:hypothetical protein